MIKLYSYTNDPVLAEAWTRSLAPDAIDNVSDFEFVEPLCVLLLSSDAVAQYADKLKALIDNGARLFVLDGIPSFENAKKAIAFKAFGYGSAAMHSLHLRLAVQTITGGQMWFYPEFVTALIGELSIYATAPSDNSTHLQKLTTREKEVAILLSNGASQYEIAQKLNISVRTVKAHSGSIYEKLGVKDRLALSMLLRD